MTRLVRFLASLALLISFAAAASADDASPSSWFKQSFEQRLEQWLDQSHRLFFPQSVGSIVMVQSDFSVLWWSFLAVETKPGQEPVWSEIQARCQSFAEKSGPLLRRIFCGSRLDDPSGALAEWSRDYPLRHPRPSQLELNEKINAVLAQATLPIGPLVHVLRRDPFGSLFELKKLLEGQSAQLKLEQRGGFFWDQPTGRVLIPLQFAFAASETRKTAQVNELLKEFCQASDDPCRQPLFIGAHASTLENETQIKQDLERVSVVSYLLLFVLGGFVFFTRRWRLIVNLPPILGATFLSAVATVLLFGRIHGLTLAFGPGLIGLSMDYGLHIAFSNQPERIWKANLSGLLTTVIVLFIVMMSEIPLLQQLMFFSSLGLLLGSAFIYIIFKLSPSAIAVRPYRIKAPQSPLFSLSVVALVAISIFGAFKTELNLDMRQLGFESAARTELNRWFYESAGGQGPLLQVSRGDGARAFSEAHEQKAWAESQGLRLKNAASFLPSEGDQRANLASWDGGYCGDAAWVRGLSDPARRFFQPFFKEQNCGARQPQLLHDPQSAPSYVRDFGSKGKWLTVWSPGSNRETELIKARYPEVISFVDIAMLFPKVFAQELKWMTPLSIGLAFLILVVYYRRLGLAALAVTPFFSGLGLYLLFAMILSWKTTFISVIGLIMVFGFSLDYGVFATDLMRRQRDRPDDGIWTALSVSTIVNVAGFFPLILCQHPVLKCLGQTLFLGTIGTFIGSIWGIPGLYRLSRLEER